MNADYYRPEWPNDPAVDETTCRAVTKDGRQCRMRPVAGELCRHHAAHEGMTSTCPICTAPTVTGLCDTCEAAWEEATQRGEFETLTQQIRWIADRARQALHSRNARSR